VGMIFLPKEHASRLAHLCRVYGRDGSNDKR